MSQWLNVIARLRYRFSVKRDVQKWHQLLAPLRAVTPAETTRTVLFCDVMTMLATAKVESLIAGLLRLRGYRTLVLLEKPDWSIEGIFRAAAPGVEFIYREDSIEPNDAEMAHQAALAIVAALPSLQALVSLEIDGFRVGRNVQSMVLRRFRVGRLDDADPRHHEAVVETLAVSLATKSFIQRLFKKGAPDTAIFVERGYTPSGEIFDGCILSGVDVVQWCGAPQSDCLIYRRYNLETRGEHPLTLSDEMWRRLVKMPWGPEDDRAVVERLAENYESGAWYNRQQLQVGKSILPVGDVRRDLRLDPTKKTAVIFCHILYDATFFYGESLFDDYEKWLVETVRAAIANPHMNWIVKVHPANVWRTEMDGAEPVQLEAAVLSRHFGDLPDHVRIMPADTGINTFSLFDVADYGLTVRGTIGMELPCFGIPVVTAGTGRYSGRGFTIDPNTPEDYVSLLARLHEVSRLDADAIRKARQHYYGALGLRPVPMTSFTFDYRAKRAGASTYDVILRAPVDKILSEGEDMNRLIHWIANESAPELLAAGTVPNRSL